MKRYNTTLLMADAAEGTLVDPLDTNVNDIDTSYPRIPESLYDLKIASAKKEKTKDGTGERLTIALETTIDVKSTEGELLKPGHKITHYIGITEKPERQNDRGDTIRAYTNADIAKALAGIAKALELNTSPRSLMDNPAQLEGKVVRAKVKINKETPQFPESNGIGGFVVRK
jgi:hypothetical protein